MRKKRLGVLSKNTNPKSGILFYSIFCLFFSSLWLGGEAQSQTDITGNRDKKPVFEIQFFSNNIRGRLDFDFLREVGIRKVIVRVFRDNKNNGGLLFFNTIFKVLNPMLDYLIPEFEGKNVKLFAWMITRNFKWVRQGEYFDFEYIQGYRKKVKRFDIFNPRAIEKIIAIYKELAAKKIDGILLQDDFFIRYNEGLSNWGKAVFTNSTKQPADEKLMMDQNSPEFRLWIETKVNQVNKVLEMIVSACKEKNPGLKIGMNIYYESPYYVKRSENWYAHNLSKIVGTGIDFVYLMSYHRQIKKEMKLTERQNQIFFEKIVKRALQICGNKLVVKIQMRDWDTGKRIPVREVLNYLRLIPSGVQRICLTPVKIEDFDSIKRMVNNYYYPSGVIFKN